MTKHHISFSCFQVKGLPSARFQGFPTRQLAEAYLLVENDAKKQKTDERVAAGSCATPPPPVLNTTAAALDSSEALNNNPNDDVMEVWSNPALSTSGAIVESVSSSGVKVKNPYLTDQKKSAAMGGSDGAMVASTASAADASRAPYTTAAEFWERTLAPKREAIAGRTTSWSDANKEVLYEARMFAGVANQRLLLEDRKRKIPDVLARKLAEQMEASLTLKDKETQGGVAEKKDGPPIKQQGGEVATKQQRLTKPMHGDITQLALQKFYVQGVCIGMKTLTQASCEDGTISTI
jgi:hypothetical protein